MQEEGISVRSTGMEPTTSCANNAVLWRKASV